MLVIKGGPLAPIYHKVLAAIGYYTADSGLPKNTMIDVGKNSIFISSDTTLEMYVQNYIEEDESITSVEIKHY